MDSTIHLHIGMRKIKTLLTIILGFLLWQIPRLFFPGLEIHPLFTYAYGILEIRNTSENTKTFSVLRIKANMVAFATALLLTPLRIFMYSRLEGTSLLTCLDLGLIIIGVLIALTLVERLHCGSMSGLAAAYFIILLIFYNGDNPYLYAFLRASQTLMGIAVAWLVNVVLLPYPSRKQKKESQEI
ncbi:MAG: hypothetical protein IKB80_03885 [Oscillospiraceae bacterium]|nr:hypothetical protein [Oscillospiraceae bacterium]